MVFNQEIATQVAEYLLEKKAVILRPESPFTWASGWKSPIYCDNRVLLSFPDARTFIKTKLAEIIKDKFPSANHITGVATAGIPQASLVADYLNFPLSYSRTKPKDHGTQSVIEGKIDTDSKIIVVEDLVSTGGSSVQVVHGLKNMGYNVTGLVAIFSYDFPVADKEMKNAGVELFTLCDYNVLINVALKLEYIKPSDLELLKLWRVNPSEWGK